MWKSYYLKERKIWEEADEKLCGGMKLLGQSKNAE